MSQKQQITEHKLIALAKKCRIQAGKTRAQAAREMGVTQTSIFNAEESSNQSLLKLRMKMIETYSTLKVTGPVYFLEGK